MPRRPRKRSTALVTTPKPVDSSIAVFESRPDIEGDVRHFVDRSESAATRRGRVSDWQIFSLWCLEANVQALPAAPATLAAFMADQLKGSKDRDPKALGTILHYVKSISAKHKINGLPSPHTHESVRRMIRGMKKEVGITPKQKKPMSADDIVNGTQGGTYQTIRDRAMLLFGFATAMRRSEICSINYEDLLRHEDGRIVVILRRSKTDQEGKGQAKALPKLGKGDARCPVAALEAWLEIRGKEPGPLFRAFWKGGRLRTGRLDDKQISIVVKRIAKAAGCDASEFGGHSLRAGYVTEARKRGVSFDAIMAQTGHKTLSQVKEYVRYTPDVFDETKVEDVFGAKKP